MTADQQAILCILAGIFGLFAWGRWRYDVVAVVALVALAVTDAVLGASSKLIDDPATILAGFGHPAVITVAAVLIISRALRNSGVVDYIARQILPFTKNQVLHIFSLSAVVMVFSAFMNNVGALALMLPVALKTAAEQNRSPSLLLMPLAFASILGGMMTLIGTPPNIIIASLRAELIEGASPYSMFHFAPVGGIIAVAGLAFVALLGWRLIPKGAQKKPGTEALFQINEYITEIRVPEDCKIIGSTIGSVEKEMTDKVIFLGYIRKDERVVATNPNNQFQEGNRYLVKADPVDLKEVLEQTGLRLAKDIRARIDNLKGDDITFAEVLVSPNSPLEGRNRTYLRRRTSHNIVLMAVARQGEAKRKRLGDIKFRVGDVLLIQGPSQDLEEQIAALRLLPLAEREVRVGIFSKIGLSVLVFAGAIAASALGWLPLTVAFLAAILAYIFLGILPLRDLYREIDWPVIVLLGAMIPVSKALQTTGCTELIAGSVQKIAHLEPWMLLALVMILTMCLSDVINNAATALIMAPIAVGIATNLEVNPDPFLMAVAVGASCAFLTPIGHQCNALILGPGGYRFGDYWRMGLPLEILIVALGTPLILHFWPLQG